MKTISINSKKGEITSSHNVPIHTIIMLDVVFVDMTTYLKDNQLGVLLQLQHQQPITSLHLTDVTPCVLLYFDTDSNYKGAAYSIKSGAGAFTIHTPFKSILFVRLPHDLKLNTITKLGYDAHSICL